MTLPATLPPANAPRRSAPLQVTGPAAAAFFIFVIVVGCYLILNLFVAILLEAFAEKDEDDPPEV